MKRPDFRLREASLDDLDAFYGLFAQVQSIHAEAETEFFRPPEKDEAFRQYIDGILGIDFSSFNAAARACFGKAGFEVSRESTSGLSTHPRRLMPRGVRAPEPKPDRQKRFQPDRCCSRLRP